MLEATNYNEFQREVMAKYREMRRKDTTPGTARMTVIMMFFPYRWWAAIYKEYDRTLAKWPKRKGSRANSPKKYQGRFL